MPASYAHYTFGKKVLSKIDDLEIKQLLLSCRPFFDIGLHGPDILFYYKPITSNHVTKIGYGMHHKPATEFFERAKLVINHVPQKDAATAYALGFLCHFILDSECHGYVNEMMPVTGQSHTKIESEFERFLLNRKRLNPITTKTTDHIADTLENAQVIASFFRKIRPEEVHHALHSFKFYSNLLLAPRKWQRILINAVLKLSGHYDFMHGLMISYQPESKCDKTNQELYRRYCKAIPKAADIMKEYYCTLGSDDPLNPVFQKDFE